MLLFSFLVLAILSTSAEAETLPYWGDRSCDQVFDSCSDDFPVLIVNFHNSATPNSSKAILDFGTNDYGIYFMPALTADYRQRTGCQRCDV